MFIPVYACLYNFRLSFAMILALTGRILKDMTQLSSLPYLVHVHTVVSRKTLTSTQGVGREGLCHVKLESIQHARDN